MKRAFLLLVLCALIAPHICWAITPKDFDDKAIPLMSKPKEADRLLKICTDALAEVKDDPEFEAFIHGMKSHAHLMKKEYDKAEREAKIVIDSGRQEDLGYMMLRDVFFDRERFDEGLKVCLQGVPRVKGERNQRAAEQDCRDLYLQRTSVTPEALWNAYKKNPASAHTKYKGRTITVLGEVTALEPTDDGGTKAIFALDKTGSKNVICLFEGVSAQEDAAASGTSKDKAPSDTSSPAPSGNAKGKPASGEDIAYSLDKPERQGESKQPEKAPAPKPGKGKEAPVLLPAVGEIVVISGNVRGMEKNNIILVNCKKIR